MVLLVLLFVCSMFSHKDSVDRQYPVSLQVFVLYLSLRNMPVPGSFGATVSFGPEHLPAASPMSVPVNVRLMLKAVGPPVLLPPEEPIAALSPH